MTGITYADLIARAEAHITEAATPRWTDRSDDQKAARAAIVARADLLQAISEHVWAIVGPARRAGHSHGNDPTERAAVALARELNALLAPDGAGGSPARRTAHPWAHAAMEIRAASDLLAVHHDPLDRPRSPDADAWRDTTGRAASLTALGPMAERLLAAEDVLAMRAGQAHVPWAEIRQRLPDATTAQTLAHVLASTGAPSASDGFGSLRLVGETPRTDTAIHELTDRITRIRHLTWDLLQHPDSSTATLRDLATLATAIDAHTAAHHTTPGAAPSRNVEILLAHARAWQRIVHDLADYLTPAPAHPEIREHVRATTKALAQIAPLNATPEGRLRGPDREEVAAALRSAVAATEKIQDWASQVFGSLADHLELRVPGSTLSGDAVTDDPTLARAKLTGSLVTAPKARTDQTIERYRNALPSSAALVLHSPRSAIEPALEPMAIRRNGVRPGP